VRSLSRKNGDPRHSSVSTQYSPKEMWLDRRRLFSAGTK